MAATSHRGELARGWTGSSNLLSTVIASLVIGLALDAWFHTRPVFVVILIIVGSIGGFLRVRSEASGMIDRQAAEAIRIRDGI